MNEPSIKRRIRFTVAYDGTGYSGWQLQPGKATVQGCLEQALEKLLGEKMRVTGAGRTDAGVHALGQAAHFDTTRPLPAEVIQRALNATLPPDIRVREAAEAPESFHARFSALRKLYRYRIARRGLPAEPFLSRDHWLYNFDLDLGLLEKCCGLIAGEHDFFTFSKQEGARKNHLCRVYQAHWEKEADELTFEITANRFLRGMVRMLVGATTAVAEGRADLEEFREALDRPGRWLKAVPAPAQGLILVEVQY
ncbi:MAG: tRNA pseudouridine(38-40) synthase TruA [Candidatus Glassbacteria bacterium RIFCSPLOWO2_12_FULL_58_11]|uniref:tRNA pseudouridine synthase A n=2 Tax=Candidatus Glassiibacteriota TaxID=1817805 RepID=A0A1F5YMD5_9BACT|nr:MAG: tRNA pseudouridine(38-40) synthase TruA [Candidatus Glassbacteria bacterium GWA2_58_10]OGG01359.1 MAG: tRNA pseudouridine(38-40) synthase TruA [Candidatus Glassbacteria bacterium RIFCSPLOWO2_12_FULL_58_11]